MRLSYTSVHQPEGYLRIAQRSWGGGPKDICLVHGFLAHSYWWHWMASASAWAHRMLAVDLSGMGKSQWRDDYSLLAHTHELAAQIDQPMWLVGHSYGGMVCYALSVLYPEKVKGLLMVDSPLQAWGVQSASVGPRHLLKPKTYKSLEEMMKSFVLLPPQPFVSTALKQQLFENSIRQEVNEYHWLFDPVLVKYMGSYMGSGVLRQPVEKPICYIAGEKSELSLEEDQPLLSQWAPQVSFVTIKDAYHAVLLDQPEALMQSVMKWIIETPVEVYEAVAL